mgnify:CR=1 FL=1
MNNINLSMNRNGFERLYYDKLIQVIPFLIKKKICYGKPSDRNGNFRSKFNLYNAQNPIIKAHYNSLKQPDDYLKDNIVNAFSNNLLNEIKLWNINSAKLLLLDTIQEKTDDIRELQEKNIGELNTSLGKLNNIKHRYIKNYQSKYYDYNEKKFYKEFLVNTIIVFSIIFLLHIIGIGIGFRFLAMIINAIIIILYILYFVGAFYQKSDRKFSNWNIKNFGYARVGKKL